MSSINKLHAAHAFSRLVGTALQTRRRTMCCYSEIYICVVGRSSSQQDPQHLICSQTKPTTIMGAYALDTDSAGYMRAKALMGGSNEEAGV